MARAHERAVRPVGLLVRARALCAQLTGPAVRACAGAVDWVAGGAVLAEALLPAGKAVEAVAALLLALE